MTAVVQLMLLFLIVCAVAVCVTRDLLASVVIYMGYSMIMSIIWMTLESPDLAITEAAVGAGITSLLLFLTLKKIHAIDARNVAREKQGKSALIPGADMPEDADGAGADNVNVESADTANSGDVSADNADAGGASADNADADGAGMDKAGAPDGGTQPATRAGGDAHA